MVEVRPVARNELAAARSVSRAAFERLRDVYRPRPGRRAASSRKAEREQGTVVAVRDTDIVGTADYQVFADRVHVLALAVRPDCQRRGVGRALVHHLLELAIQRGIPRLSLYTIEQTGNVSIFLRLGFDVVSSEVPDWCDSPRFDTLREVYMERQVDVSGA